MKSKPVWFTGITAFLSLPFWVYGTVVGGQFLPGLPISSLMVVCPACAACFLVLRSSGADATRTFLLRAVDFKAMKFWAWLVALTTMPLVMVASAVLLMMTGESLPAAQIQVAQTIGLFLLFFLAATLEELGWTAYLTESLIKKRSYMSTAIVVGVVAVIWHVIPLLQVDRSWSWIGWWAAGTIARRVVIVWLYVHGGRSVSSASLFHAMGNVSWMLFPVMGSHFDPAMTALVTSALACSLLLFSYK